MVYGCRQIGSCGFSVDFEYGPARRGFVAGRLVDPPEFDLRRNGEVFEDQVETLVRERTREGVAEQFVVADVERDVVFVTDHAQGVLERGVAEDDLALFPRGVARNVQNIRAAGRMRRD